MTDLPRSQQNFDPMHDLGRGGSFWLVDQKETAIQHEIALGHDDCTERNDKFMKEALLLDLFQQIFDPLGFILSLIVEELDGWDKSKLQLFADL
jgi:hypothetical protein